MKRRVFGFALAFVWPPPPNSPSSPESEAPRQSIFISFFFCCSCSSYSQQEARNCIPFPFLQCFSLTAKANPWTELKLNWGFLIFLQFRCFAFFPLSNICSLFFGYVFNTGFWICYGVWLVLLFLWSRSDFYWSTAGVPFPHDSLSLCSVKLVIAIMKCCSFLHFHLDCFICLLEEFFLWGAVWKSLFLFQLCLSVSIVAL